MCVSVLLNVYIEIARARVEHDNTDLLQDEIDSP